jgi:hypothetical protein
MTKIDMKRLGVAAHEILGNRTLNVEGMKKYLEEIQQMAK